MPRSAELAAEQLAAQQLEAAFARVDALPPRARSRLVGYAADLVADRLEESRKPPADSAGQE